MNRIYEDFMEAPVLPSRCHGCGDDCYNCDYAGERWVLSQRKQLELKKALKLRAISRFQREIAEIDLQLNAIGLDSYRSRNGIY